MLYRLPATLMRGGTSKGLFLRADALPDDPALSNALLLRAMGSPDPYGLQMDGLGTGISTTSKVAVIGRSAHPDCDIDYLFGHVSVRDAHIDWSGSCGNLTTAVPVFAALEGLLGELADGWHEVRIWQANIDKRISARLEIRNGLPVLEGDERIDGIAFAGAPLTLTFHDPAGGSTGKLFPSGKRRDELSLPDGSVIEATLIDAGNPTVFVAAAALGLSGEERHGELGEAVLEKLEAIRQAGAQAMGLPDSPAVPKISFLASGCSERPLTARILSFGRVHHAYTGTGAIALAAAANCRQTVAQQLLAVPLDNGRLSFAHASGSQTLCAKLQRCGRGVQLSEISMQRTARPLLRGEVYIPLDKTPERTPQDESLPD